MCHVISIIRRNIDDFVDFLANRLSADNTVSMPIDIRYFDYISVKKSNICSLPVVYADSPFYDGPSRDQLIVFIMDYSYTPLFRYYLN